MSGQSSGQTPRVSTPSQPSASASFDDNALPTVDDSTVPASLDFQRFHNIIRDDGVEDATAAHEEPQYRRHKARSSGGFLIQTTPATSSNSRHSRHTEAPTSDTARGKRKVGDGDIIVPKRASARRIHLQKPSLRSSPLTTEVVNIRPTEDLEDGGMPEPSKRPSMRSTTGQSTRSGLPSNGTSTEADSLTDGSKQQNRGSIIGLATDPAQIVNLALNLSENRRRNFSSGGLAPRDTFATRRLVSAAQPTLGLPQGATGGSLRQHLQQQRQASRNVSPRSGRSVGSKGAESPASQKEKRNSRPYTVLPDFQPGMDVDTILNASDATLSRADKARVTFELSYEYRRLLQYLPAFPMPLKNRSTTSKAAVRPQAYPTQGWGRAYNPLQYIRNRKLRIREREPLDAEGNGWNNIESVRAWVDTVANEREEGISRANRRFSLPKYEKSPRGPPEIDDLQAQNTSRPAEAQAKKRGRPRMDWIVTPWDLLADAYWLHQNDNVKRIEDSGGNKIVLKGDSLSEDPPRTSKESARGGVRQPEGLLRHTDSSPERLRASFESFLDNSRQQGRWQPEVQEPKSPSSDDDGSQRKGRLPTKFTRSRSPSSSDESRQGMRRRHRRGRSHLDNWDDLNRVALEKQMKAVLATEENDKSETIENDQDQVAGEQGPNARQTDNGAANMQVSQPSIRPSTPRRMKTGFPASSRYEAPARASVDENRLHHQRISSDDFDSTAPNSPVTSSCIPSIAINLSPPASQQSSTMSLKRSLPALIGPFRRNRSRSLSRWAVSENDTAVDSGTSTDISRQTTNESHLPRRLLKERPGDIADEFLSPSKTDSSASRYRHVETKYFKSIKDTSGPDSRLRGFLRGGRIAEIVGNEVSKVGDMLWRKESGNNDPQMNSSASSLVSAESALDYGDVSGLENSPKDDLSRVSTNNDGMSKLSETCTKNERPKYYMNNLPSFRSPFSKEEQSSKATNSASEHDHITRQQLAQRERGRSSRFDRLAPPKINMRGISSSPSRSPSQDQARPLVNHDDDSSQGSRSRSGQRVYSADRRLNAILAVPGRVVDGPSATGLSGLGTRPQNHEDRAGTEGKRHWSIADRGVPAVQNSITRRDVARVRALLLSSGVKANEILRRAEEIPEKPFPLLGELQDVFPGSTPEVSRSRERFIAARILVSIIDTTTQQLRHVADTFSHKTVETLHSQIKAVDERVEYKLTPLVRASADDADAFSMEITTTHTLTVKQLNDSVDSILRRRRRRLRWLRRGGWAMLEWALLGIMWMIWFLVVISRLVRSVIGGFVQAVRWLFWL